MGRDHPDGTLRTLKAEVISTTVVTETAASETPISEIEGPVTNSDQSYQALATWTVSADANGILYGVEFHTDTFGSTHFRLTIGGVVKWENIELPTSLAVFFAEVRLPTTTVVLLEGKSSDGATVTMWGHIEGKEIS
ncbi:hypothetical protein LCGC14_1266560 [marine sediment metagenome]|uniref:Uncharacterized protein n=1 Tax=marine sediment metagenome TaxID=412755 RepID=A0A0F9L178_9ZZZZ